jgi:pilus assembly protein CpaF
VRAVIIDPAGRWDEAHPLKHTDAQVGTLTGQAARFLEAAVASGLNVLVAGGTQAGNPTIR